MSNLAPARGAKASYFTHRVMREVVVEQETSLDLTFFKVVHKLLVLFGAERGCNERLSFTASEKGGAVYARQPANFTAYRSYFGKPPAIGSAAIIENVVTKEGFLQVVENLFRHLSFFRFILGVALYDLFFQGVNGGIAVAFFLVG